MMNEMLLETTYSDLSGYILDGFPRTAREAAIMFSDPQLFCHCKFRSKMVIRNINCTPNCIHGTSVCKCKLFPCYCEENKCACTRAIKIDKSIVPTFVVVPIKYEDSLPSRNITKSRKVTLLNGVIDLWKKQLKSKKKLRNSLTTSITFFESYGLIATYFSLTNDDALFENIRKIAETIGYESSDGKLHSSPDKPVFKRRDSKMNDYKQMKSIKKNHKIIKMLLRNFYKNAESIKAKNDWLIHCDESLPKAYQLFILMVKEDLINCIANGLSALLVKNSQEIVENPILMLGIHSFKDNKRSEILRNLQKDKSIEPLLKRNILYDHKRLICSCQPKTGFKDDPNHPKKPINLKKIKELLGISPEFGKQPIKKGDPVSKNMSNERSATDFTIKNIIDEETATTIYTYTGLMSTDSYQEEILSESYLIDETALPSPKNDGKGQEKPKKDVLSFQNLCSKTKSIDFVYDMPINVEKNKSNSSMMSVTKKPNSNYLRDFIKTENSIIPEPKYFLCPKHNKSKRNSNRLKKNKVKGMQNKNNSSGNDFLIKKEKYKGIPIENQFDPTYQFKEYSENRHSTFIPIIKGTDKITYSPQITKSTGNKITLTPIKILTQLPQITNKHKLHRMTSIVENKTTDLRSNPITLSCKD